ncbi:MAG: DUF697 domain-containing protein [Thermoguttaceae bacterium]|jgi:uncharacterized protein (DUF697 family)
MRSVKAIWSGVWRRVSGPEVDPARVDARLREAKAALPPPVLWLLGKAQSGKTSLIHALTGSSRAEIGNGFRPCTRAARLYSFPRENECFLRFLDTRGLGEVGQESAGEIPALEAQAHLLIVVLKAMDHAQQGVLELFRGIKRRHPQWPVIVLQTCLHEGYAAPGTPHVLPYPFLAPPYSPAVPPDLARSLSAQRRLLDGYRVRFVPVDFTLPGDGFVPVDYGLEALWQAIEELVPLGLQGMLGQTPAVRQAFQDEFFRVAHPHVVACALAAGGAGAVPVPLVDVPLVLAIQAKMLHAVASVYQQPMDVQRMAEIASALGIGFLTRLGVRELLKLIPIPVLSSSVSALYAAACTYALGTALCQYFSRVRAGDMPDAAVLRKLYAEEFREGQQWIRERMRQRASQQEPTA